MTDYREGLHLIPDHMRESVVVWIERGFPRPGLMGSFFRALLENDLMAAFRNADHSNSYAMRNWATFLHNYAPAGCYGSPEQIMAWHLAHEVLKATPKEGA